MVANAKTQFGMGKKTIASYVCGLLLSLVFTLIAFACVMHAPRMPYIHVWLSVLAIAQLLAQVICFLRMKASDGGMWNLMPFLFTLVIVAVLIGGSLWIMVNLDYYMMH